MSHDEPIAASGRLVKALCILVFTLMLVAAVYSGWMGVRYLGAIRV